MKLSWTSIGAMILFVVGAVLRMVDLGTTSLWAMRLFPIAIDLLLVVIAFLVWNALARRKSNERWPWLWFLLAAIANVGAMVPEALTKVLTEQAVVLSIASAAFFMVAYICFIVGFWLESIQVEWVSSKFNIWIPLIVNIIGFGVVAFFLLKELTNANLSGIWSVTFVSLVAMDFLLVGVIWAVVARTRGGKLSIPYITIGVGCILLVIFHIITSFLMTKNMFDVDHAIRILLMFAMTVIIAGGDLRLGIEKQLE
ncbi:MAG: hypothetical protein KA140_06395 [Caldisericia bacterium]|nr:hypothetical protein [Caldisericia bacterium]